MYRGALVAAACGLLALSTACGGVLFGSVPSPSPVTAASIRDAVDNSTMKNAHFRVTGKFIVQGQYVSVNGDGILQKSPASAIEMTLTVEAASGRTLVVEEISANGRDYSRVNSGKWSSSPETNGSSPTTPDTYVGEETIAGTVTWHARSTNAGKTYDIWVRESDGYIAYLQVTDPSSVLTMTFDTYNQSPLVTAPV